MRTLRNHVEKGIQQQPPEDSAIIAWMARWAAELLSKHAPGDDGRIPYERVRREGQKRKFEERV